MGFLPVAAAAVAEAPLESKRLDWNQRNFPDREIAATVEVGATVRYRLRGQFDLHLVALAKHCLAVVANLGFAPTTKRQFLPTIDDCSLLSFVAAASRMAEAATEVALPRLHLEVALPVAGGMVADFAAAVGVAIPTERAFVAVVGLPSWHPATTAVLEQVAGPETMVAAGAGLGGEPTRSGQTAAAKSAELVLALPVVARPLGRQDQKILAVSVAFAAAVVVAGAIRAAATLRRLLPMDLDAPRRLRHRRHQPGPAAAAIEGRLRPMHCLAMRGAVECWVAQRQHVLLLQPTRVAAGPKSLRLRLQYHHLARQPVPRLLRFYPQLPWREAG